MYLDIIAALCSLAMTKYTNRTGKESNPCNDVTYGKDTWLKTKQTIRVSNCLLACGRGLWLVFPQLQTEHGETFCCGAPMHSTYGSVREEC